ncbi:MAG: hypothetical protein ACR2P7_08075 [bacterium]
MIASTIIHSTPSKMATTTGCLDCPDPGRRAVADAFAPLPLFATVFFATTLSITTSLVARVTQ